MAKFAVMASELKSLKKSMEDRKLAELKKEIIEILKKQDEKDFKKAIDYFESQELHFTHLEKSLVSGKWIEKAGYGVGTVRIWKGKKYKKIAPGKWARVFDKEGRGTNIAIGKLIARVNKIDNAEDLLQFVMENKQRFIDEDGRELGILDKVRAAVDTRNEKLSGESSPYVYGVGENVNRAKNEMFSKKDKIKKEEADLHKVSRKLSQIPTTELKQEKARLERAVANKTRSKRDSLNNTIFRESNQEKLDAINKELEKRSKETSKPAEKYDDKAYEGKLATQKQVDEATAISNKYEVSRNEMLKKPITTIQKYANSTVEDFEGGIDKFIEYMAEGRSEGVSMDEVGKEFAKLINHNVARKIWDDYESGALVSDEKGILKPKESETEKTQNRSEAMKGNKNARKFGTDWEEKRKEIQGKLTENTDKLLEDNDNAKDAYEKLQNHLNKRKADAELYRKYLGNQEEPEDVKDFRKWCDDVIEQYRKEVTNTPSKEIIFKWEVTAKNTPTEKLEEVYNGKQKVDYTNYYENYIDSTIINTFAKDKDLIFPQPYTMLKDIATRKFDNSDKIRLEIIKKELESRKNKMEKSLFDDFIVDVFAADDEKELEEELKAGETEYNDYSAEQPELFNSTAMKVREALDRIKNQVL